MQESTEIQYLTRYKNHNKLENDTEYFDAMDNAEFLGDTISAVEPQFKSYYTHLVNLIVNYENQMWLDYHRIPGEQ